MCPVTRTKKAWHFFAFIGTFEVFDYLYLPITTSKAHAIRRERRRFTLGDSLKVSKFQRFQCISYFAFSYSMVCITGLCGFAHRRFISLLLISFCQNIGAKIQLFLYARHLALVWFQVSGFKVQNQKRVGIRRRRVFVPLSRLAAAATVRESVR